MGTNRPVTYQETCFVCGMAALISPVITGAVMLGTYTGISSGIFLNLGMKTMPVYLTMAVTTILVVLWHSISIRQKS